jgi:hypothetical protein
VAQSDTRRICAIVNGWLKSATSEIGTNALEIVAHPRRVEGGIKPA